MPEEVPIEKDLSSLPDPDLTENARRVLDRRYLIKDEDGEPVEKPKDMFWRVAVAIAEEEEKYGASRGEVAERAVQFYTMMSQGYWMPNSPTLTGAGRELGMLSACFVLPVSDTLTNEDDGIYDTVRDSALVWQAGGGTGYDFSQLRPEGSRVKTTTGVASGPVSFMEIYDKAAQVMKQGGHRRAALMGILRCDHPDILRFIEAKADTSRLTNFNISVAATDAFMEAARNGEEYDLHDPRDGEVVGSLDASEVLDKIIEQAHATGEPGLFFVDRANEDNPIPHLGDISATNPCLTGDTPVFTADGRASVPIRQLAEEGEDVPVFCLDDDGNVVVRTMRNPRKTGRNKKILEITLDNGESVRVTEDHKFLTRGGEEYVRADSLEPGQSLFVLNRYQPSGESWSRFDQYVGLGWSGKTEAEHVPIAEYKYGISSDDMVGLNVHHKNGDKTDNRLDNILLRSADTHLSNHSAATANPRFSGRSHEEILAFAVKKTEEKGRRLGRAEWQEVASRNGYPTQFSGWRDNRFGGVVGMLKEAALEADIDSTIQENADVDPRVMRTYRDMLRQGYNADIQEDQTVVEKKCEYCGDSFWVSAHKREISYCGHSCASSDASMEALEKARRAREKSVQARQEKTRRKQVEVYLSLQGQMDEDRDPYRKEWEKACKRQGISAEISRDSSPFTSWAALKEMAQQNHKVVSVRECGREDVYTGTVDDYHNFFCGGFAEETEAGTSKSVWLNNLQCGEIPLPPHGVCNLGHVNIAKFVSQDGVDWEGLRRNVQLGVRFLDNVIDANNYPLPEIRERSDKTRRIGHGVMGWADALIKQGIPYDSEEAIEFADEVAGFIHRAAVDASKQLADERGPFPAWEESEYEEPRRNSYLNTVAPTGCVEKDSIVSTGSGLVEIDDIVPDAGRGEWVDHDIEIMTDEGLATSDKGFDNGASDVIAVETSKGFSVAATPDHKFRVFADGEYIWKEIRQLSEDDWLVLSKNSFVSGARPELDCREARNFMYNTDPDLTLPNTMNSDLAEFLGYYMGDGYVHDRVGVKLAVDASESELIEYLKNLGKDVFGVTPTVEDKDSRLLLSFGGRHLPRYFHHNGWAKTKGNRGEGSAGAFVPRQVMKNKEDATSFVRGLMEADGSGGRNVELVTSSKTLAQQVQALLLSLGHVFNQTCFPNSKMGAEHYGDRDLYKVRSVNRHEAVCFVEDIGFITKKINYDRKDLTSQSYKMDVLPVSVIEDIDSEVIRSLGKNIRQCVVQSRQTGRITRRLIDKICQFTNKEIKIGKLDYKDVVLDQVKNKTHRKAHTKDISVPENHTYIANGFITHNTTSIIAGCSGGIEPIYAVAFMRNQAGMKMPDINDDFVQMAKEEGWYSEDLMEEVAQKGSVQEIEAVPEHIREIFKTAHDVAPPAHINMQAVWQQHTEQAISKCVAEGTLIPTNKGLIPIEDIGDSPVEGEFGEVVSGLRTNGDRITGHYNAGQQEAVKVRFDNGGVLVGAAETHSVKTPDGWCKICNLETGDVVIGGLVGSHGDGREDINWANTNKTSSNGLLVPDRMSPELAKFLGMLCADGYTHLGTGKIELSIGKDADPYVEEVFTDLCQTIFGVEPNRQVDKRNGVVSLYLTSRNVARWVKREIGSGAYNKEVPRLILQGSRDEKISFLNGLTLDGYIDQAGALVVYGGMSEVLAYQTGELLRSFKKQKVRNRRKYVKYSDAYAHSVAVSGRMQSLLSPIERHKDVDPAAQRWRVNEKNGRGGFRFNTTGSEEADPAHKVTEVGRIGAVQMYDIEVENSHCYITSGVVSHNTINFPTDAGPENVREGYLRAYNLDCKGITVYRDGSREGQALSVGDEEEDEGEDQETEKKGRPRRLSGYTERQETPLGRAYVTINERDGDPFEVFVTLGKAGGTVHAHSEAIGRLISAALRHDVPVAELHEELLGISSDQAMGLGPNKVHSLPDGIAQVIGRYIGADNGVEKTLGKTCPDCDAQLEVQEGCQVCRYCGYSACG